MDEIDEEVCNINLHSFEDQYLDELNKNILKKTPEKLKGKGRDLLDASIKNP
jgi:hypothetical protein